MIAAVLAAGGLAADRLAGPESGKAGPLGLLVVLLLGLATVALIRSMNRHLRKVPPSFQPPSDSEPGPGQGSQGRQGQDEP